MKIKSWMGAYRKEAKHTLANNLDELKSALTEGGAVVGNFHSYSKCALHDHVIQLGEGFKQLEYREADQTCTVGAACTIREVMEFLLEQDRRLINHGNHMGQTFVGACLTGTHGFGPDATMADQVVEWTAMCYEGEQRDLNDIEWRWLDGPNRFVPITKVRIKTAPLTQYHVTNCICKLSQMQEFHAVGVPARAGPLMLEFHQKEQRAYAVLPYSGNDPVCIVAEYESMPSTTWDVAIGKSKSHVKGYLCETCRSGWRIYGACEECGKPASTPKKSHGSWWRIKLFWAFDSTFPFVSRWLSKSLNFFAQKEWTTITNPCDLDALYDTAPGVSLDTLNFALWAMKPTFRWHNNAYFVKPEETADFIEALIEEANKIKHGMLRGFIGVRELTTKSKIPFAGNSEGPVNAIDVYFKPKHVKYAEQLQAIMEPLAVKMHRGKRV